MKKPLIKKLEDPVYNRCIYLAVGPQKETFEKCEKILNYTEGFLEVIPRRLGCMMLMQDGAMILWMPKFKWTISDIDTLTHEIFHLTYAVMSEVGVRLCDNSEEAFAYYQGYITRQILTIMKKHK